MMLLSRPALRPVLYTTTWIHFSLLLPTFMKKEAPCKFSLTKMYSIIDLFYPRCHGNPLDRSQFSVEADVLFSNLADFPLHGRRHLKLLNRLLIGRRHLGYVNLAIRPSGWSRAIFKKIHCAVIGNCPMGRPILLLSSRFR